MVGHLEPGQGDLGVLPASENSPGHSPAPAGQGVTANLDINPPDPLSDRYDAAATPLTPASTLSGDSGCHGRHAG
jgi:hypothetical protein